MIDYDTLCDNAFAEINKITKKLPVDERSCANCKHGQVFGGGYGKVRLSCYLDEGNSKFIGVFSADVINPKNRRYNMTKKEERLRKKMAHKCDNHVEENKFRVW